jgi:hypothetical protein
MQRRDMDKTDNWLETRRWQKKEDLDQQEGGEM